MDEQDIREHMAWAGAQVAMEVPTCLRAVQGSGSEPRISPLTAGGKAKAANEASQQFGGVVVAALNEAIEPVAAEGMCDVVAFHVEL
jgi:hypothetical protein